MPSPPISGPPFDGGSHDPRAYLRIVWRWKLLLLVIVTSLPVAAYLYTSRQPKIYESSTLMQIPSQALNTSLLGGGGSASNPQTQDAAVSAQLVTTTKVALAAADVLKLPRRSAGALLGQVTATPSATGFVTISAREREPGRAARVANAFGRAVINIRRAAAISELSASIAALGLQLASLARNDPGRPAISAQLENLRALRTTQGRDTQVVEAARPVSTPISPRVGHSVLLAAIAGLLLGFGAVAAAASIDQRIREPGDLVRQTGLPLLSEIPKSAFEGPTTTTPADAEAFRTLRASLTYFNIHQPISSVIVTSSGNGDGKTTVVTGLATALARAGNDVVVVDADLRRPTVAARFGLGNPEEGLGSVLIGGTPLSAALIDVDSSHPIGGRLRVLASGLTPPNPSELIGSQRMCDLLAELTGETDIVIVDSPPLLAVSDAVPLLSLVSGVVLVARMGTTSRAALDRLQSVIATAGGRALGVVATGATVNAEYQGYGYSHGVAQPTGNGRAEVDASEGSAREVRPTSRDSVAQEGEIG